MDTTEKERLAQEQLDELKAALKKSNTTMNSGAVSGSLGEDMITLSGPQLFNNGTMIGGVHTPTPSNSTPYYTVGTGAGATITSGINWGAGTTTIANPWSVSANTNMSGKLNLDGDEADIVVNGVSLMEVLRDRLNVMIPNPELEKEWDELKELGDKYRKLEAELKEKGEMWAKLKQTPPDPLY